MLVHILSKTGGSKRTYLFRVKLQFQKNGEDKTKVRKCRAY